MKKGILLINLGTPDAATRPAVRRYLREFLSDPYVIDLPAPIRWTLLNGLILPFRTRSSTEAYQKIWTDQGSPLLVNSQLLSEKLQASLNPDYVVELAMRYQNPSLEKTIKQLLSQDLSELILLPLYPQYAESTTRSSIEKARGIINKIAPDLKIKILPAFFNHPDYLSATSQLIQRYLDKKSFDHFIFSYHGLPERHIRRVCNHLQTCDLKDYCPSIQAQSANCYRAQCYTSSNLLAEKLALDRSQYTVAFQSRLGKTPWITPYTDHIFNKLAGQGIKKIAVVCPSFVTDCLETLEEVDIRGKAQWLSLGGLEFYRVPCLNDEKIWVDALVNMIHSMH